MSILGAMVIWIAVAGAPARGLALPGAAERLTQEDGPRDPRRALVRAEDLPGDFRLIDTSGVNGYSRIWASNELIAARSDNSLLWAPGIRAVKSFAFVGADADDAVREFDRLGLQLLRSAEPVELVLEDVRAGAGIIRGMDPFSPLTKVVVFQSDDLAGYVSISTFEAPSSMADVAALATLVLSRGRSERGPP